MFSLENIDLWQVLIVIYISYNTNTRALLKKIKQELLKCFYVDTVQENSKLQLLNEHRNDECRSQPNQYHM